MPNPIAAIDNQFVSIRPKRPSAAHYRRPIVIAHRGSADGISSGLLPTPPSSTDVVINRHRSHRPLSSPVYFDSVLKGAGADIHQKKRRLNRMQVVFFSLAAVILGLGGYMSYVGFMSNAAAKAQATNLTRIANIADKSTADADSAPSTNKISAHTLASYSVAPNLPRYIKIPKLNVYARVLSVGVNSKGALGTPNNVYDTAWYNESAAPGENGAMLIDGHVSSWTTHGVFYGIKKLEAGDSIQIIRGDGKKFTYSVVKSVVYPSGNVDMTAAMTSVNASKPGLNLITCAGDVIPGTSEFNERIVVYAVQT